MWILDTNHFSELERDTAFGRTLLQRIERQGDEFYITVISIEEVLRGRLAMIAAARNDGAQLDAYRKLRLSVAALNAWTILEWDEDAVARFHRLRREGVRIATLDLRIASIALAFDATLLTRNLTDFRKVPGLKIANWLD